MRTRRRAFSLLEVMVAMVLFGLVMSSLYVSFRTGMKAYDIGATHSEAGQAVRYVVSQVSDDLRNVFFKPASQYNITRRQREAQMAQVEQQQLKSGSKGGAPIDELEGPELGPKIDLGFRCEDNGETDDLTFVRTQNMKHGEDRKMWGLARVHYFVSGEALYRSVDDITAPETDEAGNDLPKPVPPQVDKVANHVKAFELKFGYYYEGEWTTAPSWDSEDSKYRNPSDEEEEEEKEKNRTPGSDKQTQQNPPDGLPAWVEISYTFTDPKKSEKEKTCKQVVQLLASQETYVPPDESGSGKDIFQKRGGKK